MLMICWFYCMPFAHLLFYAAAPIMLVFAAFMLRRGVLRARRGLRLAAFVVMFVAAIKIWIFDLRALHGDALCTAARKAWWLCSRGGFASLSLLGLVALVASCGGIFLLYRRYLRDRPPMLRRPEQAHMRYWANASMTVVVVMILWTLAPWVASLTVGDTPAFFAVLQWQHFAAAGAVVLLAAFWRAEGCQWNQRAQGTRYGRQFATWSPRDTLWTAAFLYLVTLMFSYVAHDVLK